MQDNENEPSLELHKASEYLPYEGFFHAEIASIFFGRHDYAKAEAELRQAIKLDTNQVSSHYQLCRILNRQGHREEAWVEIARSNELRQEENSETATVLVIGSQ